MSERLQEMGRGVGVVPDAPSPSTAQERIKSKDRAALYWESRAEGWESP